MFTMNFQADSLDMSDCTNTARTMHKTKIPYLKQYIHIFLWLYIYIYMLNFLNSYIIEVINQIQNRKCQALEWIKKKNGFQIGWIVISKILDSESKKNILILDFEYQNEDL